MPVKLRGPLVGFIFTAALLAVPGCHRIQHAFSHGGSGTPANVSNGPATPVITGALIPAKPHKPFIGNIEFGVFAREASEVLHVEKLSINVFTDDKIYDKYREAVRDLYGADMSDMNYFSIGHPLWQRRIGELRHWLIRAGAYGAPTLALEPDAPGNPFAAFTDSPELQKLRAVFEELKAKKITVWIRFASEANLYGNPYSVSKSDENLEHYKAAARWWKGYMPDNAKLVFSPLINTPYQANLENNPRQLAVLKAMYEKGVYGRIGGTLYATAYNVSEMYDWYTGLMRQLDADTPLQVCELGGPLARKQELVDFINSAVKGRWKGLEKINLFAGQVNSRAQGSYGRFGFVVPGTSVSYIRQIFFPDSVVHS